MAEQRERFVSRGMETIEGFVPADPERRRARATATDRRDPAIVGVIETQLLPRIALAHSKASGRTARGIFSRQQIIEFAEIALGGDQASLVACVRRYQARGCGLDLIYLDLIQPAARHLGERWSDDTATFVAVTLGLCQMHRLLQELSPTFHAEGSGRSKGRHALLCPAANEQHSFGVAMLSEFLRRDGWLVSCGPFSGDELEAIVRRRRFALVGFSLSRDSGLEVLAAQIRRVRQLSLNRAPLVLVGGRVFNDRPELVTRVGADGTARDARHAVAVSRDFTTAPADNRG